MVSPVEGLHDTYLATIDLSTHEKLNIYNKAIVRPTESDRYDLNISKWTDFYHELEDAVSTFGFKSAVLIVTSRYEGHTCTEVNNTILSYPYITKIMVKSHFEVLWADNSGADLGRHLTANCSAGQNDADKQAIIAQQRLM